MAPATGAQPRVRVVTSGCLLHLEAPVGRVTHYDVVMPYFARELLYMPDEGQVKDAINKTLDF